MSPDAHPDRASADRPWSEDAHAVAATLGTDPTHGLSPRDAHERLHQVGPNRLHGRPPTPWWKLLGRQLASLVVALLGAAAAISLLFGETTEAAAIVAVLAINTMLGFVAELRAVRSMEALRRLGADATRVRRSGRDLSVPAEEVVPGDLVVVESGERISADLRIVQAAQLEADESVLTGESVPVAKAVEPVAADAELHERTSMLFKGTTITRGAAFGVVVSTGMRTEIGGVAALVAATDEEPTPLELRLAQLVRTLMGAALLVAALTAAVGIVAGKGAYLMVQTGIALAIAAIPEGLPIVATIALARGMWRMAERHALINRLSSVETLGATTVILTDKTGTLTENRLEVREIATADDGDDLRRRALRIGALCSDASLDPEAGRAVGAVDPGGPDGGEAGDAVAPLRVDAPGVGDPLEVALLIAAEAAGLRRDELLERFPEQREVAFDADIRMMATFHRHDGRLEVAVKGAAEAVLERCTAVATRDGQIALDAAERARWERRNVDLAAAGHRVLAVASRWADGVDEAPYEGLTLVGLFGLVDPPRDDAAVALQRCREAGIRVVMVTGDQAATALHVGRAVGLVGDDEADPLSGRDLRDLDTVSEPERQRLLGASIFARVNPAQKLALIDLHRQAGAVVAMTGDGVNDAPALKRADIGVAMGRRGTQIAQEASDMVLTDDSLASIVAAIHQGRVLFGNIRTFVAYLMACNVSEILVVAVAAAADVPLPLLPLQILFLNLVTDVFPALALALGEGDAQLMREGPRDPRARLLDRRQWLRIGGFSAFMTLAVLTALALALYVLEYPPERAVTISFATLAMAQIWHVFNMRDPSSGIGRNEITRNAFVWGALLLCTGLVIAAAQLPALSRVLHTPSPGASGWVVILTMSVVPLALGQLWLALSGARRRTAS